MYKKKILWLLTLVLLLDFGTCGKATAVNYQRGAGSYTDVLPSGGKAPQTTIYKTSSLTGAIPTNSWESSILWYQHSLPIYAHPLTFKYKTTGLEIGTPALGGAGIACFGGHKADFTLGHSNVSSFPDSRADRISGFAVDTIMQSGNSSFKSTIVKGSPYSYFTFTNGNPVLSFSSVPTIYSGNSSSQYLGLTVNGVNYGIFAPSGSTFSGLGTSKIICNLASGKNYFSIAVLPDTAPTTLNFFKEYAYSFITDTKVQWNYNQNNSTLTTTYTITTSPKEGSVIDTIIGLYPHHWRNNLRIAPLPFTYSTIRGTMKTIKGRFFNTVYTYNGILPTLPDQGNYDKNILNNYINQLSQSTAPSAGDTYWVGKYLGKIACGLPIAEQLKNTTAGAKLLNSMKSQLENWFTASSGETSNLFYYDKNWGSLIGYPASYGSDETLNDHHFHYGYFIHAAAQVALRDPSWGAQTNYGAMTETLIKEIANWDEKDTRFPFLRNFDPYEGHSWASGNAGFEDGNNQESSSEAINAWQAIILWGEATGNKEIRDLGIYLYTTEIEAINSYWFDIYEDVFSPSYGHNYASMVWGAKYSHEIWWDGTKSEIHGINFLPYTGGSLYLGKYPTYVKRNYDEMIKECGGSQPPNWKDIQYMYYALYDPSSAKTLWNDSIVPEDGESKAHTYHWIYNLDSMGLPDFSVTANTPLYSVFSKNNTKTYVVYNAGTSSVNVTFSDGKVMSAPAKTLLTSTGSGNNNSTPTPFKTPSSTPQFNQPLYGDVNNDDNIDSTDLALMKRHILGIINDFPASEDLKISDVSGDGVFDSIDLAFMKRFLLQIINVFPVQNKIPTQPTFTNTPSPLPTPVPTNTPGPLYKTILQEDFNSTIGLWNAWWGDEWNGKSTGSLITANNELKMEIASLGSQSFNPQVFYEGFQLEKDQRYIVSFKARASVGRKININIGKALNAEPWFTPYMTSKTIDLTTNMTSYSFSFDVSEATYSNIKIVFEIGTIQNSNNVPSTVFIDDVKIEKLEK